ncbi:peptidylprolyl isomerase [Phenylobacterium sp.]|uniref:peptidylprolyl isomerase n=1 Tax=Phenylobacterium sp. TaxID=1871053 RepID=UPI002734F908|nr:peptidylprolyl isomerase [Phenylobacterium sp.]MDP3660617.1 SurA N-terminal domain-containing protein [Phenylobacterium sp.]
MLSAIRNFAKSWVAAVLIGLLIVSFAVFGISDIFNKQQTSNAVIVAGKRQVTGAEFRREFDSFKRNAEQQAGQPLSTELAVANGLDARLLQELTNRAAFGELMRRVGVIAPDSLVVSEIRKIPAFFDQMTGRFDEKLYQQKLGENQLTREQFEQLVRDDLSENQLAKGLVSGMRAPRAYTALAAAYGLETRDIGYFTIEPSSVPAPPAPTDAQLTGFMKLHAAELTRPELRILTVVSFSPANVAANLPIDEKALMERYNFRKDTLSQPETRSLVQIPVKDAAAAALVAARLGKGEDPTAVAKSVGAQAISYVGKPKSAIPDRKVADAAFALTPGQVSGPVQGDLGLAVVKVLKSTPGRTVSLEEIRPQLEAELRKDAAAEKVYALTQAYDDAHAGGASLTEAAQKAGVPALTLPAIAKDGRNLEGQQLQGMPPKLLDTAFGLPLGGESEVQETGDGSYYAVRVEKILPAAVPPLAEIKPQLTRVWIMEETVKRLQARADQFAERLRKGESLEAVASAAGAKPSRALALDRATAAQNKALSGEALGRAFSAKPGDVFIAPGATPGLVVAKLEAVRAKPDAQMARMTEEARPQMTMVLFRDIGDSARRAAREQLKVKVNTAAARAAIGLEPAVAKGAAKGEKAK